MSELFDPSSPGEFVHLQYHSIKIVAEPVVRDSTKYYLVDVEIAATHRPSKPIRMLMAAIDLVSPGERQDEALQPPWVGQSEYRKW